ncbi:hypothetical protein ANCCAN_26805 [Ancylostoma caninum]|uniref:Uncharacterized protein n=1 Tax=Ancylostoma caninum TaxID=29170 RepID=A0A368F5Q6_ANCCA|nr:hypothetical protein ANCCAN_26805 [Ancylostoma caninum]
MVYPLLSSVIAMLTKTNKTVKPLQLLLQPGDLSPAAQQRSRSQ